jgi:hypothetical protein
VHVVVRPPGGTSDGAKRCVVPHAPQVTSIIAGDDTPPDAPLDQGYGLLSGSSPSSSGS